MNALRILLVDDHLLFRKGLARLLEAQPDFRVVGEAADGLEAVEQAQQSRPDVVLMDVRMPICDGIEATRRIKAQMPEVRVVMLTVSEEESDLAAAARSGADGYLLKDLQPEMLFRQLRGLRSGETPIAGALSGKLFHWLAQQSRLPARSAETAALSARECEVLALVVLGYSNPEIAIELGIARNTVKNHLHSILAKLGVKNRAQAAAYAVSRGLVRLPEGVRPAL